MTPQRKPTAVCTLFLVRSCAASCEYPAVLLRTDTLLCIILRRVTYTGRCKQPTWRRISGSLSGSGGLGGIPIAPVALAGGRDCAAVNSVSPLEWCKQNRTVSPRLIDLLDGRGDSLRQRCTRAVSVSACCDRVPACLPLPTRLLTRATYPGPRAPPRPRPQSHSQRPRST